MCRGSESSGVKFIAVTLWSLDFLGGCQREGRGWGQGQAWRLTSEQAAPQVVTGVEGTAGEQGFLRTGCQAQSSMPVSSPSSQEGGDIITVPVNRWGRRHRTMNSQAQGHRAGTCQSWGLSLGHLPLETDPSLWWGKPLPVLDSPVIEGPCDPPWASPAAGLRGEDPARRWVIPARSR